MWVKGIGTFGLISDQTFLSGARSVEHRGVVKIQIPGPPLDLLSKILRSGTQETADLQTVPHRGPFILLNNRSGIFLFFLLFCFD